MCDRGLVFRQTRPRQAAWLTIDFGNQGELSRRGGGACQPRAPIRVGALALEGVRTAEGVGRILERAQAQVAIDLPIARREPSDGYRVPLVRRRERSTSAGQDERPPNAMM